MPTTSLRPLSANRSRCSTSRLRRALPLLLVLGLAAPACSAAPKSTGAPGTATVTRLVDGDTLVLRVGGRDERVRLIGIDTPETKDPRKPVQCYGKEASALLAALLPPGTAVRVERDAEARDRYGRLLLYVWRSNDDLFVNLRLAQDGAAVQLRIPPNTAHAHDIAQAVSEARHSQRGLWGSCGGPGKPVADGGG